MDNRMPKISYDDMMRKLKNRTTMRMKADFRYFYLIVGGPDSKYQKEIQTILLSSELIDKRQ
jgi:hypothetical protein